MLGRSAKRNLIHGGLRNETGSLLCFLSRILFLLRSPLFPFPSVARRTTVFLRVFRRRQECRVTWGRGERVSFPPANPPFPKLSSDHVRSGIFPWTRKFVGWHDSRVFQPRMWPSWTSRTNGLLFLGEGGDMFGTRIYTGKNIHCVCEWKGKLNILDEESVFKTGEIEWNWTLKMSGDRDVLFLLKKNVLYFVGKGFCSKFYFA